SLCVFVSFFFFQAEDGIRDSSVTGVQTCALPISALAELDVMLPVSGKYEGDYYLLRAQVLDGMGKTKEAVDNLNRGFRASPTRQIGRASCRERVYAWGLRGVCAERKRYSQ